MAKEFKIVWLYDQTNNNQCVGTKIVDLDYQLVAGETFVKPADGLYGPIHFETTTQTWIGVSKEEWEQAHPSKETEPSESDQAMNALGLQVASLTKENQGLKKSINALGLQVAQAIVTNKQSTTETDNTEKEGN